MYPARDRCPKGSQRKGAFLYVWLYELLHTRFRISQYLWNPRLATPRVRRSLQRSRESQSFPDCCLATGQSFLPETPSENCNVREEVSEGDLLAYVHPSERTRIGMSLDHENLILCVHHDQTRRWPRNLGCHTCEQPSGLPRSLEVTCTSP